MEESDLVERTATNELGKGPWKRQRALQASINQHKPANWNDVLEREAGFQELATRIGQDKHVLKRFLEKTLDIDADLAGEDHISLDDVGKAARLTKDQLRAWTKRACPSQQRSTLHAQSSLDDGKAQRVPDTTICGDSLRIWG